MGSKTTVSLLLHVIILSITLSDAQYCYTTGNFTANSTYAKNRDLVLRSLASNVTPNGGFYNTTIGSGNDTVYGLVHCMASPSAGNCSFCVNSAIQALMTACPNQKEAISWGGDPVPCIVRYANRYFFGSLELSPTEALYNTGILDTNFTQFGQIWSGFRDTVTRASTNSFRLAAETTDLSSTQKIYVFMQCTPDVSQSNCGECLQQSVDYYKSCCYGQQGGVVQTPNCFFRWDLYPYYNLFPQVTSPPPSAAPSPPSAASPSPPASPACPSSSPSPSPSPPPAQFCYTTGNFTANSTYEKNRDLVLRSLASNVIANDGFYITTIGLGNDTVYGLAHCMASPSAGNCSSCVNYAIQALMTACPNQKEAISWGGNPVPCIVRYANRYFFGSLELSPNDTPCNTGIIDAPVAQFNQAWSGIRNIVTRANSTSSSRHMLAAETTDLSSTQKIYVFMQCTPDVSQSNCVECLQQSLDYYKSCCYGQQGAVVLKPNCFFRWDLYPYYNLFPKVTSPSPLFIGKENTTSRTVIVTTVPTAILLALVILILTIFRFRKPKQEVKKEERNQEILLRENSNHSYLNEGWPVSGHDNSEQMHYFSLKAIRLATNNFSDANKLGEGGFGPVYKGTLPDGEETAVKRLCMTSKQGLEEFRNEVMVIAKLQHKNLVRLLGYCLEGDEKLLVYEYLANTSLDAILFDPNKSTELHWPKRANIISGTARGLQYLHEDSRLKIIHRDMKASNVLLDDQMNPKISDFGTARIFGGDQLEANTNKVVGTFGYMAPEYALEGIISTKSDVYSFGILLLEIITGKKSRGFYSQDQAQSLLFHAWQLWNEGRGQELIDRNVVDSCPIGEALRWIHIALLCVQDDPARRPTMSLVVLMLGSNAVNLPQPSAAPNSLVKFTSILSSASASGSSFLASDQSTTSVSLLEGKNQQQSDERRDP